MAALIRIGPISYFQLPITEVQLYNVPTAIEFSDYGCFTCDVFNNSDY